MDTLPTLQASLNFVAFMANLIDLKHFHTILVLYDQTTRNEINLIIENLPRRCDVAWLLVNDDQNPDYWNNTKIPNQDLLVLTAVQSNSVDPLLDRLYRKKMLSKRCKHLIASSDIYNLVEKHRLPLHQKEINAVLVDWASDESVIFAWNPYGARKWLKLNETEFLRASKAVVSAAGKYSGIFFDKLQNMRGRSTRVLSYYDTKNVFNVVSRDSVDGVDGTEIRIIDLIGEALQSSMEIFVRTDLLQHTNIDHKLITDILERTFKTYAPIHPRRVQTLNIVEWARVRPFGDIATSSYYGDSDTLEVYPHSAENIVIVVQHNTKIKATAIQRIFASPIIYLWLLLIVLFVVVRCGLQWLHETKVNNSKRKLRRCVYTCQDTVQLSCGVLMSTKLFASQRYRHALLAHGATIIPFIVGMFISGLLYGEYLMKSEKPTIDSIEQLQLSELNICIGSYIYLRGIRNRFIQYMDLEILDMIWSGNTSCAYMVPERYTSLLDMAHLQQNGRPMFHVIKERFVAKYVNLKTPHWFLHRRLNAIVMRSQEHGFVKYFESVSKRTFKQATMRLNTADSSVVAKAGGLQEILIACGLYLVGITLGIVIFMLELLLRRKSR